METGANFQQRRESSSNRDFACRGRRDARQHLQHSAFTSAVVADDAKRLAVFDCERNVFDGPKLVARFATAPELGNPVGGVGAISRNRAALADQIAFGNGSKGYV